MGEILKFKPKREDVCSFCLKHKDQVKSLISGHSGKICDECLAGVTKVLQTSRDADKK